MLNVDSLGFDLFIYRIKYIKNLNSSNSLNFFHILDAYFEKSRENKYLMFVLTDKNEMALREYTKNWDEIKNKLNR